MNLATALIATFAGAVVLLFFREKPPLPVSPTAALPRTPLCATMRSLFCDGNFFLLSFYYAIIDSAQDIYRIIILTGFGAYGVTSSMVASTSLAASFVMVFSMNLCGCLSSRVKRIKVFLLLCAVSSCFIFLLCLIFIHLRFPLGLALVPIFSSLANKPPSPLIYELVAESSFPVPEAFSGACANLVLKVATFGLIQASSPFIASGDVVSFVWIIFGLQVVGVLLVLLAREVFARRDKDEALLQREQ